MKLKRSQLGLTLIELVVVIIILGILSVIAAPKLLSLSSEAQTASLKAIAASIESMNKIVHSKTQLDGIDDRNDCDGICNNDPNWDSNIGYFFIDVSGTRLYVYNGYPKATGTSNSNTIVEDNYKTVMGLSDNDFVFGTGSNGSFAIVPKKYESKLVQIRNGEFQCHIQYRVQGGSASRYVLPLTYNC